jgi:hypothetical protein
MVDAENIRRRKSWAGSTSEGLGNHHYAVVRPSVISFDAKDDKWHATMNVNADELKAAPEYKYPGKC